MTVQFPEFAPITILDYANLRDALIDKFPVFQQALRIPPIETNPARAAEPNIQLGPSGAQLPRILLISSDSQRLMQFQSDRFGYNWRRTGALTENTSYPGFETIKLEFADTFRQFGIWVRQRFGASIQPLAAELFYTNAVPLVTESGLKRISEVFRFFSPPTLRRVGAWQTSWVEPLEDRGYVQAAAAIAALPDGTPVGALNLTGRVRMDGASADPTTWFDAIHALTLEVFQYALKYEAENEQ